MRRLLPIFLLTAWSLAPSCDVITEPFKENPNPVDTTSVVRGDTLVQTARAVFIEDFTGHRCKNCPKASKAIKALDSIYGPSHIIPIALHAGASNFTGVNADYPTDFTTSEGDDIASLFGIFAMPMGMVQRVDYPTAHQKTYTAWAGLSAQEIASSPEALFTLSAAYDSVSRQAIVNYSAALQSTNTNALGIVVYLKESHIISPQLMPNNTRDEFYVHKNVFRAAPLGPTGVEVSSTGGSAGQVFTGSATKTLDPIWNPKECEWVVILYDRTNYRVLQPAQIFVW
ncbi:MAG: Omp28-related outer membrane protein [Schleiferiaceae bacterium]|nr:Omp28-related outer membrane protein [Schleiferiaceae bacterium]